jgi:hypothetical protein
VAIMPHKAYWDHAPPKTEEGFLHPDVYWFATILDLRADEDQAEMWAKVAWFYSKKHFADLKQTRVISNMMKDM